MKVTLLGTGCPGVDTHRYGAATLVEHETSAGAAARLLVDCGSGVTQRLVGAGTDGAALDAILITHIHSDHLVDLYQLIVSAWHQNRDRPQRIFGPRGLRAFVEATMETWRTERELRIAHERRTSTAAFDIEVTEIDDGWSMTLDGLTVRAVEVDHAPVKPAFGFVFEADGRRAVLSGDTRHCAALIAAAKGADLLVHEVYVHRDMQDIAGLRTQAGMDAVAAYHTLSDEVGKIAAEAGVGALMLTHFVPPRTDRDALLAEVRADFPGPVLIGEDLMSVDLADRTVRWGNARISLG